MKYQGIVSYSMFAVLSTLTACVVSDERGGGDSDDVSEVQQREQQICPTPLDGLPFADDCDGGGGGGGGGAPLPPPPPPPPPPVDTSESYLGAAARTYLAQAGVPAASDVGGTKWVNACKVRAEQGAGTFNSGITRTCTWANLSPGWIILEVTYDILRNDHGRGSASVNAVNGSVTVSTTELGSKFSLATSLAVDVGDFSAEGELSLEYQRLNAYSFVFNGTGNNLVAEVTANGGLFRKSVIEIQAKAKLLRIY